MVTSSQVDSNFTGAPCPWLNPHDVMQGEDNYILADGFITHDEVSQELYPLEWRVREFDSLESLAELRTIWNALASKTPGATHFLTYDWLATYWKHNSAGQKLRILVVSTEKSARCIQNSKDQKRRLLLQNLCSENISSAESIFHSATVIGIIPLAVRNEKTRLGNVRVLTFPLHGWGSIFSPLGPCADQTLYKAFEYLAIRKRDYDLLDLRWIDNRLGLGDVTAVAMHAQKLPVHQNLWHDTAQIDLTNGWESYWAGLASHWRTNVRSNLKKINKVGRVEYVRYRPEPPLSTDSSDRNADNHFDPRFDLYEACEKIASKSWQGERMDGTTLSHAQVRDYLREAHETAVRCGAADINLLLVDNQPVAFAYNYAQFGSVYGLRAGYDPAFKQYGVGSVLMHHMLQDSATRGDRLFDLGPGNIPSKEPWLTSVVPCYRYTYYSPWSLKAWGLRLKHAVNQK